jgi:hypothetical protein
MEIRMKYTFIIFMLSFSLSAIGQDSSRTAWKVHTEGSLVRLSFPPDWQINNRFPGVVFYLFSPKEDTADNFSQNLNLYEDPSDKVKTVTVDGYADSSLAVIRSQLEEFELTGRRQIKTDSLTITEIRYSGFMPSLNKRFRWVQRFYIIGETGFVLTYTAEKDRRDPFLQTGLKIMDGLIFLSE